MGHARWQYMAVKIRVKPYFANIFKFIILSDCSFFLWPTKLDRLNYQAWISHTQISHFFFENLCFGREEKCRDLDAGWMDLWIFEAQVPMWPGVTMCLRANPDATASFLLLRQSIHLFVKKWPQSIHGMSTMFCILWIFLFVIALSFATAHAGSAFFIISTKNNEKQLVFSQEYISDSSKSCSVIFLTGNIVNMAWTHTGNIAAQ